MLAFESRQPPARSAWRSSTDLSLSACAAADETGGRSAKDRGTLFFRRGSAGASRVCRLFFPARLLSTAIAPRRVLSLAGGRRHALARFPGLARSRPALFPDSEWPALSRRPRRRATEWLAGHR